MAKILSINEIRDVNDVEFREVPTPEWGEDTAVRIGSLDAGVMIEWVEANEGPAKRTAGLRLIIQSLVDENGHRIGKDSDLQILRTRNQNVCGRIIEAILDLNGLGSKRAMVEAKNG